MRGTTAKAKSTARTRDARRVAKILRDGGYSYDQSKHLIGEASRLVGLTPPRRRKGSVDRLTREELDSLLAAAYAASGVRGLMLRTLLETGSRVGAFTQLRVEDIAFAELEIRVRDKGGKSRDVPILKSLAHELRIHLGDRESGFVFPSPRGGSYSRRRLHRSSLVSRARYTSPMPPRPSEPVTSKWDKVLPIKSTALYRCAC